MARCTARSRRTKEPCKKWARQGYTVCEIHGAGRKGKNPRAGSLKHGLYAKFLNDDERATFAELEAKGLELDKYNKFATSKVLHALRQETDVDTLTKLVEKPVSMALKAKQVQEGLTLTLDVTPAVQQFLTGLVALVMQHCTAPDAQAEIVAYVQQFAEQGVLLLDGADE